MTGSESAVLARLRELAEPFLRVEPSRIPVDVPLMADLGLDSLDVIAFLVQVENEFPNAGMRRWSGDRESTLQDLADYICRSR